MRRLVTPIWIGASPLVYVVAGLVLVGLIFQLAQRWISVVGDSVWLGAFLLFAVAAVVEKQPPQANIALGIAATACFVLAGLGAAGLMLYWILVDSGQVNRNGDLYTISVAALGVLGVFARLAATRRARR